MIDPQEHMAMFVAGDILEAEVPVEVAGVVVQKALATIGGSEEVAR